MESWRIPWVFIFDTSATRISHLFGLWIFSIEQGIAFVMESVDGGLVYTVDVHGILQVRTVGDAECTSLRSRMSSRLV
jgi:hypothetical protein